MVMQDLVTIKGIDVTKYRRLWLTEDEWDLARSLDSEDLLAQAPLSDATREDNKWSRWRPSKTSTGKVTGAP